MVRMKQQAFKHSMTQSTDSPPVSNSSTKETECQKVKATVEMRNPQKEEMRVEKNEERTSIKSEESTLPPLPKEREINQPAVTTFFTKSPKRTATETNLQNTKPRESKGKEKVTGKPEKDSESHYHFCGTNG